MSTGQSKGGAPVVGFNHNLSYKGRTFHVQTEDSGPQHGHVITHVFLGGNILASTKSSYAALVPTIAPGELAATVRRKMEEQHKAMIKGLVAGQHDAEISRRVGDAVYEPGVLADGERAPGLLVGGDKTPPGSQAATTSPRVTPVPAGRPGSAAAARQAGSAPTTAPRMKPVASSLQPPAAPRPNLTPARGLAPVPAFDPSAARSLDELILAYLAAGLDER